MGRSLPVEGKAPVRKAVWRTRGNVRSNSVGALACQREACIVATTTLCRMCRASVDEPRLPVVDVFMSVVTNAAVPWNLLQTKIKLNHQPGILDLPTKSVQIIGANRWDFDVFSFKRRCSSQLLCCLGVHLLEMHDLFRKLRLDYLTVMRALTAVESVYWQHNPYHTALHASDVTQAIHCFISLPKFRRLFSPAEILGALLAALCHDADHPGTTQVHLERTEHFLTKLYNSNSVLEQHHARVGLAILHQSGLAKCLTRKDWHTVKDCIVKMVHATDMAHQGFYKAKFVKLANAKKDPISSSYSASERMLLLQMSLKCADVSNPCRPWQSCRQWAYRICEEFFCQGDQERFQWSLAPSRGCSRVGCSVPAIQIAFIDSCITPLFTIWHDFFQSPLTRELVRLLGENYEKWQQELLTVLSQQASTDTLAVECSAPQTVLPTKQQSRRSLYPKSTLARAPIDSRTCKNSGCAVTFNSTSLGNSTLDHDIVTEQDAAVTSKAGSQSFFITTCGLRRHSLPETQGAIKKTFNFAVSKKSITNRTAGTDVPTSSYLCHIAEDNDPLTVHCVYVNPSAIRSLRTGSANILQTLCEEFINHDPGPQHQPRRAFELDPFPLPDAWNRTHLSGTSSPKPCYLTKISFNFPLPDFVSFANRRSSLPLINRL